MNHRFELEIDGKKLRVDQAAGTIHLLDAAGNATAIERIQVAASKSGLFSAADETMKHIANPVKNS